MVVLDSLWHKYLTEIGSSGHKCEKDDGDEIREIIGVHKFISKPQNFPGVSVNDAEKFLSLIKKGAYDIDGYSIKGNALFEYVTAWDKDEMIYLDKDDFIYTYPERLFNYHAYDKLTEELTNINQYRVMIDRLTWNISSNRAVATLYNCGMDRQEQHIPCLNFLQALVRDDKLVLVCMFRSNDIFNAWPSNMYLLTYLGLLLSNELDVEFMGIDYHCSSAHYYITEESLVKKVIE